jgi:anti-sigma B factor antagonist
MIVADSKCARRGADAGRAQNRAMAAAMALPTSAPGGKPPRPVAVVDERATELVVSRIRGDLDQAAVLRLREELASACVGSVVLIDMGALLFIDAAGLRALVAVVRRIRDGGGDVVVSHVRRTVKRMLELAHFDRAVPTLDPTCEPRRVPSQGSVATKPSLALVGAGRCRR